MDNAKRETVEQLIGRVLREIEDPGMASREIRLTATQVAAIYWYAQSVAVRSVCDRHADIMRDVRRQALACRYHKMVESMLPESDEIYDPRYGEDEIGSWGNNGTRARESSV